MSPHRKGPLEGLREACSGMREAIPYPQTLKTPKSDD
jgi:hypothetical protein